MKKNIEYQVGLNGIEVDQLNGFFVGWPNPPSKEIFYKLLNQSYTSVVAIHENNVVGFVTAISDGVLSAYLPLLEVLPEYQSSGIGSELVKRIKKELKHLYMIDVICDENLVSYYEKLGLTKAYGAVLRNYKNQNGKV